MREEGKINFNNLKRVTKTQYLLKINHNFKERMVMIKTNKNLKATSCYWYYDENFKLAMRYDNKEIEEFIINQFNEYVKTLL